MLPTFWPGDLLTIRNCSLDQVKTGDVVLYSRDDGFFIHRVLRTLATIEGVQLITRGDSMPNEDAPVRLQELLGKVISVRGFSGGDFALRACNWPRRWIGLALAYSDRLRSLALRWHAWRSAEPATVSLSEVSRDHSGSQTANWQ